MLTYRVLVDDLDESWMSAVSCWHFHVINKEVCKCEPMYRYMDMAFVRWPLVTACSVVVVIVAHVHIIVHVLVFIVSMLLVEGSDLTTETRLSVTGGLYPDAVYPVIALFGA